MMTIDSMKKEFVELARSVSHWNKLIKKEELALHTLWCGEKSRTLWIMSGKHAQASDEVCEQEAVHFERLEQFKATRKPLLEQKYALKSSLRCVISYKAA